MKIHDFFKERKRSNRPHDFLIQERQRIEAQRQIAQDQKTAQDAFDLMNNWQIRTGNIIRVRYIFLFYQVIYSNLPHSHRMLEKQKR